MHERIRKAAGLLLSLLAACCCFLPIRIGTQGNADICYRIPARTGTTTGSKPELNGTVDINCGDISELCELPGIGETIAALIIDERESNGPFRYPEDLLSVKGIGQKKLQQIIPYLDLETEENESGEK